MRLSTCLETSSIARYRVVRHDLKSNASANEEKKVEFLIDTFPKENPKTVNFRIRLFSNKSRKASPFDKKRFTFNLAVSYLPKLKILY
jgi:hypothetical protein